MQSAMIVLLGIAGMSFGWFVYSKFIATKIYQLDPDFVTPAHEFNDGVDFYPTNKYVLWGHHFTSVAGAAPIVGPAIAVYWGWVPAVLWVTIGTIFFAGVHDFGAIWASARHKGKSIGALSQEVIGSRTRALFMIVIFLVLLMVNAVFGVVIAKAFVTTPGAVFPAWSAIAVAIIIGQLVHRNFKLSVMTILGVIALYFSVYIGSTLPLELPEQMFGLTANANWIIILFIYAAIASMLPVWVLLQPRDFINGMQLVVGLILLYGAVLLSLPDISAPAFNNQIPESAPSMLPLLFVTIACGAVSGFHGIVSSGTTSKQLNKETDARFVGYLGAVGEGSLALITLVAVSSVALAASPEAWHRIYDTYGSAGAGTFIQGGAQLIQNGWGLPFSISQTLLATMVVLLDDATEFGGCLYLLPGSHRDGRKTARYDETTPYKLWAVGPDAMRAMIARCPDPVPLTGKAGTAAIFHCNNMHASGHNLSAKDRWQAYFCYNTVANRPTDVDNPRPDYVRSRNWTPMTLEPEDGIVSAVALNA